MGQWAHAREKSLAENGGDIHRAALMPPLCSCSAED
jgi:hypothetical protein